MSYILGFLVGTVIGVSATIGGFFGFDIAHHFNGSRNLRISCTLVGSILVTLIGLRILESIDGILGPKFLLVIQQDLSNSNVIPAVEDVPLNSNVIPAVEDIPT